MTIELESRAYEALQALLKQAESCRVLFEEAGLAYPEPLKRVLGIEVVKSSSGQVSIGPPPSHSRPRGVPSDWVAVPASDMLLQTATVAILRQNGPLPAKSILGEFGRLGLTISAGSLANAGTRLESQGLIKRSKSDGWTLVDESTAPVLSGEYVWADKSVLAKQELAARRREAIRYVLSLFPGGLQNVQILERLEGLAWLATPVSKDLVKVDMEEMARSGLVKRNGHSRKWVLVEPGS